MTDSGLDLETKTSRPPVEGEVFLDIPFYRTHYAAVGDDLISLLLSPWPNVVSVQPLSWLYSLLTSSDVYASA